MNTLTSVVLLSLLVVFSQGIDVSVQWGLNLTLVGPSQTPVEWHGPRHQLCKGKEIFNPQFNHTCNEQNLTLLFVNYTFQGDYHGFQKDNMGKTSYKVTVTAPPAYTRKPLSKPKKVDVKVGNNVTLVGPTKTPVQWYGPEHKLCEGKKVLHPEVNHTCNEQNLTLLFVNRTFAGAYLGFDKGSTDRQLYEVTILDDYKTAGQTKDDTPQGKSKQKDMTKSLDRKTEKQKTKDEVKDLDFPSGSNQTLVGPPGTKVDWYTSKNGDLKKLCDGKTGPKNLCNHQNLTLHNVSRKDEGSYYGSNDQSKHYRVTVYTIPRNKTVKIKPYTTKGTTKTTLGNHSFDLQLGNGEQSEDDQKQIPSTTVAIVVGVIAGFITLIIVILCYICCRKRPRAYNNMVDPLLSFSY